MRVYGGSGDWSLLPFLRPRRFSASIMRPSHGSPSRMGGEAVVHIVEGLFRDDGGSGTCRMNLFPR